MQKKKKKLTRSAFKKQTDALKAINSGDGSLSDLESVLSDLEEQLKVVKNCMKDASRLETVDNALDMIHTAQYQLKIKIDEAASTSPAEVEAAGSIFKAIKKSLLRQRFGDLLELLVIQLEELLKRRYILWKTVVS